MLELTTLHLDRGGHDTRDDGVCLMEAVAWFAGERHTDAPQCVSPVLRSFGISLNDLLADDRRQRLVEYVPRVVGTAGDGLDNRRGWLAVDWIVREYTPTWLELARLTEPAGALRAHPEISGPALLASATDLLRSAASQAAAARAAAWAAGDAAWAAGDAAGDAAWAAARDAAGDAARAAARAAARDAARDAARAAARDAAWAAARAAGDAACDAAGAAAAWAAAARDAARDALAPTVERLQDSAITLFGRMIAP